MGTAGEINREQTQCGPASGHARGDGGSNKNRCAEKTLGTNLQKEKVGAGGVDIGEKEVGGKKGG